MVSAMLLASATRFGFVDGASVCEIQKYNDYNCTVPVVDYQGNLIVERFTVDDTNLSVSCFVMGCVEAKQEVFVSGDRSCQGPSQVLTCDN